MEHDDDQTQRRVRKGSWMREEDVLLRKCIEKYGEGNWNQVPLRAGLNRCRKSCRLRWLNYLKPNIKQGEFAMDEVDLIIKMHKLLGNKWSLIAGRLPGRTANGVKNYWNTHLKQKQRHAGMMKDINKVVDVDKKINITSRNADERKVVVVRPQPRSFSENSKWIKRKSVMHRSSTNHEALPEFLTDEALTSWWQENIDLFDDDDGRMKKRKRSVLAVENVVTSSAGCCCRCRCNKSTDQSTTTSIDEEYQELCVDDYLSEQQRFHVDKKRNISDIVGDESQLQSDDFDDLINLF